MAVFIVAFFSLSSVKGGGCGAICIVSQTELNAVNGKTNSNIESGLQSFNLNNHQRSVKNNRSEEETLRERLVVDDLFAYNNLRIEQSVENYLIFYAESLTFRPQEFLSLRRLNI